MAAIRARLGQAPARVASAESLRGVRFVRDRYGWREVVRVNTRTVTVHTGYWDARVAVSKILEWR
ncbi:hypothetical protein GCM10009609_37330 [Pseudonocardia aurantiaca]|uniref:Transposase n=1 Tax=Pseudonocardia aurantiaca TaxID=75290 RepID=A0ABW4FMR9_9PSEU